VISVYRGMGLEIPYPENWKVSNDGSDETEDSVFIESPKTAFLSLARYDDSTEPAQAIDRAVEAMESEYEDIEQEDIEVALELKRLVARELRFYYLDLVVVSRLIAFRHSETTYLVQQQAEDREFSDLEPVFFAMMFGMAKAIKEAK
jgi:hypothetical protein